MDFTVVLQAITTVGFPIVLSLILLWYIKVLNENHKEEAEKFTNALNSNTLVLQKLCDALSVEREV